MAQDIFDEVSEELRGDRARALLRRYAVLLVAALVAVVAGVGAWEAWQAHRQSQTDEVASLYMQASHTADTQKGAARHAAIAQFEDVAKQGGPGYAVLARLREAGVKADAGDLAGASALWDQVAGDADADPLLRDLANLQWAQHHLDSAPPAAIQARLAGLQTPTNPWHALADEAQAMLDLRQGKTEAARTTLQALLVDATAPPGVRRRADGLLASLGG